MALVSGYRSFFAVNAIAVTGRQAAVGQLAGAPGVVRIEAEDVLTVAGFFVAPASGPQLAIQDNIKQINADGVWLLGFRGQGVIVASIDTGVRYTHEALKPGYKCRSLSSHANCWFDAVTDGSVAAPYDDHGHGSHVTGIMAGRRGIGVAKRAKWTACKAFNSMGSATASDILECSDFFMGLALSATTASFTLDVINNSWSGGRGSTFFNATVDSWNAAGIHSAFAIGNEGPSCRASQGPGEYTKAFGVGAVSSADTVASFSSRGAASAVNGGTRKPDVVAPGVSIRSVSAACNTCYAFFSGTSMATPHGVGTLALMLSKNGGLTTEKARSIAEGTALKISNLACGGTASDNNVYGRGRVDALAAVNATP